MPSCDLVFVHQASSGFFTTPAPPGSGQPVQIRPSLAITTAISTSSRVPAPPTGRSTPGAPAAGPGRRATSSTVSRTFWSSQLAGNSVLPGLPVPCLCPPPLRVESPSRMWAARSGLTRIRSGGGRSPASTASHPERSGSAPGRRSAPPSAGHGPRLAGRSRRRPPGAPRNTPLASEPPRGRPVPRWRPRPVRAAGECGSAGASSAASSNGLSNAMCSRIRSIL